MFSKPGVYCAGFQAGSAHFPFVDSRLIDELSSSKKAADGLHRTASRLQFGGREKEGMSWTYIPLLVIDMKSGLSSSVKTSYQVCSPPSEIFFEVALSSALDVASHLRTSSFSSFFDCGQMVDCQRALFVASTSYTMLLFKTKRWFIFVANTSRRHYIGQRRVHWASTQES